MKRDWDLVRDVLVEVERLDQTRFKTIRYGPVTTSENPEKDGHGILLWKAGFIEGANASSLNGDSVMARGLTWAGCDLLDTIRSNMVWERIKATAAEKGIELTFDAVKTIGKTVLAAIVDGFK